LEISASVGFYCKYMVNVEHISTKEDYSVLSITRFRD